MYTTEESWTQHNVDNPGRKRAVTGITCPVPGCNAFVIGHYAKYRRHWLAKHERFVSKYFCPQCRAAYKRKDDLRTHVTKHAGLILDLDDVECQFLENKEFLDPDPITLETAMDYKT
ncbi:zinc finger E-box-binding homeobox 1-like X4 [Biomphalaria pfeifferi]|uniref:Zinc finger E-box-binding homeobox 1-like X4 n=1 Tax=Biomphalaria pfeifferi TaxID=112525 RepID=A0AAD8CC18_BIOPF|nr:zinc finger E-box-binding homeobox 1-like X4 [Biomphalaria pfeifferi]